MNQDALIAAAMASDEFQGFVDVATNTDVPNPDQLALFDVDEEMPDPVLICAAGALEESEQRNLPIVVLGNDATTDAVAEILLSEGERFLYTNDLAYLAPAIYVAIDERYGHYEFPPGSYVIDPFSVVPDRDGVVVRRLGRR